MSDELKDKLPIIEFQMGSLVMSRAQALRELGYEDPEELMKARLAEDLADDPRVRAVMVEELLKSMEFPSSTEAIEFLQQQLAEIQTQIRLKQRDCTCGDPGDCNGCDK